MIDAFIVSAGASC